MLDTTRGSDGAAITLVMALFLLYIATDLAQVSQALDGVVYADIARNLSIGEGTFWAPVFFDASGGAFRDHPPLGLWLMSIWFALWGDAFWV